MKRGQFGLGLALGTVAGVVVGLLTAPKPGKGTRDLLRKHAQDLKHEVGERATDVAGKAKEAAAEAKTRAEDYRRKAGRAVDDAKKAWHKDEGGPEPESQPRKNAL